jgi:type IV secretion system protein VirB1
MDLEALIETCATEKFRETIASIIQVESRANPFSIGTKIVKADGDVFTLERQPQTKQEAIKWAQWLIQNRYRFDAGLMQINSQHFKRLAITPEALFDECSNIKAGATILGENYVIASKQKGEGNPALLAAISAYNTGNFERGFTNGYVKKVSAQQNIIPYSGILPPLKKVRKQEMHGMTQASRTEASFSSKVTTFKEGWHQPSEWKAL